MLTNSHEIFHELLFLYQVVWELGGLDHPEGVCLTDQGLIFLATHSGVKVISSKSRKTLSLHSMETHGRVHNVYVRDYLMAVNIWKQTNSIMKIFSICQEDYFSFDCC